MRAQTQVDECVGSASTVVKNATEREKLMFRVRVRIDADWLRGRSDAVSSGLPGVAYVLTDPATKWPDWLQVSATL